jgi:hypothetical protein
VIKFLLTNWWIYIPIVAILLFLTYTSNQQLKNLKRQRELQALPPEQRQAALQTVLKRDEGRFERFFAKLGLRGILSHIFTKK